RTFYRQDFGEMFDEEFSIFRGLEDALKGKDLTRGQTYWIGAEVQMRQWTDDRTVRAAQSFRIEPAQPQGTQYAAVTVMTHGFVAPIFGAPANANSLYYLAMQMAADNDAAVLVYDITSDG